MTPQPGPVAYRNGEFIPAEQCTIAMHDLGVVLGAAVTDLVRTFNGEPYRLGDHIGRLYRSARYARIPPPVDEARSAEISRELVARNLPLAESGELCVVYYLTAGQNPIYAGAAGGSMEPRPTYIQHTFPLPHDLWRRTFTHGVHCVTPAPSHWAPASLSSRIKHRNRLHMWIGDQEAKLADPAAVPLYLDQHGAATETGGSNFVIYSEGQVISPRRSNILWGISLTTLTEILADFQIAFLERDIYTFDVINSQEAWLPTTPYCLGPVVRINGVSIGDGAPGPMWRRIIDEWSRRVGKDIHAEFTGSAPA